MSNETDPRAVAVALLKKMNLCQVDGLGVITPPALIDTDTLIPLMEVLVEAGRAKMYTLNVRDLSPTTSRKQQLEQSPRPTPAAEFRADFAAKPEWQPMETAPEDGTVIEILFQAKPFKDAIHRCRYTDVGITGGQYHQFDNYAKGWRPIDEQ